MTTYYVPRHPRSASRVSSRDAEDSHTSESEQDQAALRDLAEASIYIFPNPASAPFSPGASISSAPTDFDFSCPSDSRSSHSRLHSRSQIATGQRRSTSSVAHAASVVSFRSEGLPTTPGDCTDMEVELWDLDGNSISGVSESNSQWAFDDSELVSGSEFQLQSNGENCLTQPSRHHGHGQSHHSPPAQARRRSRKGSAIRTISVSSLSLSSIQQVAPHPRVHVPLLSFFSSLLSVDLDDPALRLLTHAEPEEAEAVLFPGHSSARLLSLGEEQTDRQESYGIHSRSSTDSSLPTELPSDIRWGSDIHGLPKLLLAAISDQSTVALRSLRAGLAVHISHTSGFAFPLPSASELLGLWRAAGGMCYRSGQAWKELWNFDTVDTANIGENS
ncbi:hypothetical protein BD414DRAFT_274049 [Trametes punicea]|nr:hypothetical protein BD414DRAFT_274049 [Trametes punicea]